MKEKWTFEGPVNIFFTVEAELNMETYMFVQGTSTEQVSLV